VIGRLFFSIPLPFHITSGYILPVNAHQSRMAGGVGLLGGQYSRIETAGSDTLLDEDSPCLDCRQGRVSLFGHRHLAMLSSSYSPQSRHMWSTVYGRAYAWSMLIFARYASRPCRSPRPPSPHEAQNLDPRRGLRPARQISHSFTTALFAHAAEGSLTFRLRKEPGRKFWPSGVSRLSAQ
jgi:hypothetical protein